MRKRKPETKEIKYNCVYCGRENTKLLYKSSVVSGHVGKYCNRICMIAFLKKNSFSFNCVVCEKEVKTQPSQINLRSRETCSRKCRYTLLRKRTEIKREEEGYTKHQLDRLARSSPEATEWRESVFKRDDYTCQMCKVRGTYLEADHIKPWAFFPDLRFELSNGRTLCRPCHDGTKISAKEMRKLYA